MLTMSDELYSLDDVLAATDRRLEAGLSAAARVTPTGFHPLDTYLSGGLRAGELTLLGGPQGLGKTTMALQILRNVVVSGGTGIYFSFEHDPATVLERFISIEAASRYGIDAVPLRRIREAMESLDGHSGGLVDRLTNTPGGAEAVDAVSRYANRLHIHRASGGVTDLRAIRSLVDQVITETGTAPVVVVDYLQKVPVLEHHLSEEDRITAVAQGLKDLALEREVAMFAVVASDKEGIASGRRMRVHHLRGAAALAYEADVVLVINDKYDVVARHHLVFDVGNAERFRDFAVITIEKNRTGIDRVDLEFRKRFEQGRFETEGAPVGEQLVDERVFVE
jgi:replicative DNA helicase